MSNKPFLIGYLRRKLIRNSIQLNNDVLSYLCYLKNIKNLSDDDAINKVKVDIIELYDRENSILMEARSIKRKLLNLVSEYRLIKKSESRMIREGKLTPKAEDFLKLLNCEFDILSKKQIEDQEKKCRLILKNMN